MSKIKVLSIDGGGIRGVFPAMILAKIEAQLKNQGVHNWQVYQNFDLICGTSTGGILALALSLGIPANEILNLYINNANQLFGNKKALIQQVFRAAHNQKELEAIVRNKFKESFNGKDPRLNDCKTAVAIPIYDLAEGTPAVLKSRYHKRFVRDYHIPAYQAAMATSAAPTYYNPFSSEYQDLDNITQAFKNKIDGGVFANDPSLSALIEAKEAFEVELSNISLLSLGTGYQKFRDGGLLSNEGLIKQALSLFSKRSDNGFRKRYGINYWMIDKGKKRIIEVFMQAQSQQVQNLISLMRVGIDKGKDSRFTYLRINTELDESSKIEMDETDKKKIRILTEKANRAFQNNAGEISDKFIPQMQSELDR